MVRNKANGNITKKEHRMPVDRTIYKCNAREQIEEHVTIATKECKMKSCTRYQLLSTRNMINEKLLDLLDYDLISLIIVISICKNLKSNLLAPGQ